MLEKVVRVFVSSTFKDMQQERAILHSDLVQGQLRRLCELHGFQFQLIDLRWGVSQEAGWDQRTEELCLEEISRCRNVSPRPNFVALVSQRYGWRPLPQKLTRSDWNLVRRVAGQEFPLLEDWYRADFNSVPFAYRLRPRLSASDRDRHGWGPIENKLRDVLLRCLARYPERVSDAIRLADKSLTEKEIGVGAESAEQREWQAFAYFRDIDGKRREELGEPFVDLDENGKHADPNSSEKLDSLRRRLVANPAVTTRAYSAHATGDGVDKVYLEQWSNDICADLSAAISRQLRDFKERDPQDREIDRHREFARARLENFTPRPGDERRIVNHLRAAIRRSPLVVAASSGSGKTAFAARIEQVLGRQMPGLVVVTRFIGATVESSSLRPLVRSIHRQVARETGSEVLNERFTDEPARLLGETLRLATRDKPVLILLDALDQLAFEDHARLLNWLPISLPPHAALVATVMSEGPDGRVSDVHDAAVKRWPRSSMLTLTPMKGRDLERAFSKWLKSYRRTLTPSQNEKAKAAIALCPRPLYVRILAELAQRWDAQHDPGHLPEDIQGLSAAALAELERDTRHRRPIVAATLAKLAASRTGLTEPELVELLSRDASVVEDFRSHSRYEYMDEGLGLPPIVWSRRCCQTNAN